MVAGTRAQNKNAHPAAPIMSEAAKNRAGIKSTKTRTKKPTKDEQIHQLQAQVAALENPDQTTPVSNEPLVVFFPLPRSTLNLIIIQFIKGSSPPPDDDDPYSIESEAPTEVGSDDFVITGGKRVPSSSQDPR
jgi:hypothetical protein